MLNFETEQKVVQIGNVKLGGQPGENPIVLIGSVFYTNHQALLDEKSGKFDKNLLEKELNEFTEIIEDTNMQGIIDVIGGYPEALVKECEFVADIVDFPFLVDGLNDSSRIPAMARLREIGLIERAILNSIDEATTEESLEKIKEIGVKNAFLLTFGSKYIFPKKKLNFLKEILIPKAQKANIDNYIVDTAVLDLPSISINFETTQLIKSELGIPTGFSPANVIYAWNFIKKYGESARCGAIASLMTYCATAAGDFILYGPIKYAKCVIPSIALISGVNSYYRKRILRKPISERTPLKKIF
jgi:tetrahydromethanopterin S-methyltransferase subunit H